MGSPCLSDRVEVAMSTPPITVPRGARLWEAARVMYENNVGSVLVVDEEGRPEGIITRKDMLYYLASGIAAKNPTVAAVMKSSIVTARPDETLEDALKRMIDLGIRHLPVVDEKGKVRGMISSWDILRHLISCQKHAHDKPGPADAQDS